MRLFTLLIALACAFPLAAQPQSVVDLFQKRQHTFEGFTMPYRLFVPDGYDGTQAYPLVVAFHGSGERGTDNERHIAVHRLATAWADPANQARNPAFVLAPQLPTTIRWTMDAPISQSSFNIAERAVLDILDALESEFAIDTNRVYLTGLSLGGHATWDFVSRLPERFAAAVPMSGRTFAQQADRLADLPLWVFHGESDTVVPVSGSRAMVFALEQMGRTVIYTDCKTGPPDSKNFDCPSNKPSADSLRRAVEAGADLFYTGVRFGGHGPWAPWFDNTIMQDWLFRQYRLDPAALTLSSPAEGAVWDGTQGLTWQTTGAATDTVEISVSVDDGKTWQPVARVLNTGAFDFDTAPFMDSPVARIRLEAENAQGFMYSREVSNPFYLDNPGDGAPFVALDTLAFRFDARLTRASVDVPLVAADPERQALSADLFWSIDGGTTYTRFATQALAPSQESQTLTVNLADLPNSTRARMRVEVRDGANTVSSVTPVFTKENARSTSTVVERVAGTGRGEITLHVVDRAALTGSHYEIRLDSTDPFAKTYSVYRYDPYVGEEPPPPTPVLTGIPLSDGVAESPAFDGIRLVVEDADIGMADLDQTGWVVGDTDLGVAVKGGETRIAILFLSLLDTEDTYELTMTEAVADTSVKLYNIAEQDLRFTVTAQSDGQARDVAFKDANKDGRPGNGDVLYILEKDANGELAPAWEFTFTGSASTVAPETGDVFRFVPLPKLGTGDVFAFVGSTSVAVEAEQPTQASGLRSAPNPFSSTARITYHLDAPAHITLDVYDMLGRRVALLGSRDASAGPHVVVWDGTGTSGQPLAAGTYLLRLTVRERAGSTRTRTHHIVRVE